MPLLDCGESGSTLRFLLPVAAALGGAAFTGSGRLPERPIGPLVEAMKAHGAVYFAAVGGAAALMASCVTGLEVICWDDLGPESVKKLTLQDLPLIVAIDAHGNDAFRQGQAEYLASIHE